MRKAFNCLIVQNCERIAGILAVLVVVFILVYFTGVGSWLGFETRYYVIEYNTDPITYSWTEECAGYHYTSRYEHNTYEKALKALSYHINCRTSKGKGKIVKKSQALQKQKLE